ncbi:hypothetical protein phiJL1_ORF79 [Lactobacillus phage phiJL-1]|uniref:Uncharacterized protein n=1 Tax=Lactobacillus phage phiJL-1 TaxID=2892345 RepID=Q597W3_9CAUD|nr:hypothetical protein phiJL1_ORF79 [Lactobacillus phage phiJL-1]AAP74508.1 hypothetical protein [Lactobacillus phage phiJL-1]
MNNYDYSPQELKIIMDIANKHKIPISLGDSSITIHSQQDFKPLMVFSVNGMEIFPNIGIYYKEIERNCEILMCGVAIKS